MYDENARYTSIEEFRAAFYPHLAWWMEVGRDEIVEWPELEDEIVGRYRARKRAEAAKKE
jgi:hypothetical protein